MKINLLNKLDKVINSHPGFSLVFSQTAGPLNH